MGQTNLGRMNVIRECGRLIKQVECMKEPTELDYFMRICGKTARAKGWHDFERNHGELIALIHSELSEWLEELRLPNTNKDNVAEEIADVLIRIYDYCWYYDVKIRKALINKMKKNLTRPIRHGKKF